MCACEKGASIDPKAHTPIACRYMYDETIDSTERLGYTSNMEELGFVYEHPDVIGTIRETAQSFRERGLVGAPWPASTVYAAVASAVCLAVVAGRRALP